MVPFRCVVIMFSLYAAGVLAAGPGEVLFKLPVPMLQPFGMTAYGDGLLLADRASGRAIAFDPGTRAFGKAFTLPCPHPLGIAGDGQTLWVYDPQTKKVLHYLPSADRVDRVLVDVEADVQGLAWDGAALWATEGKRFLRMDPTDGTEVRSFDGPGADTTGIAWDGRYLWLSERRSDRLAVAKPDGTIFGILPSPGPYPTGLVRLGDVLWVLDFEERMLYALDVSQSSRPFTQGAPHRRSVTFTQTVANLGPSSQVDARLFACLGSEGPHQKLLKPLEILTPGTQRLLDSWGQPFILLEGAVPAGGELTLEYRAELETRDLQWFLLPEWITPLQSIPEETRRLYLADGAKLQITDPVVQDLVRKIVGSETNPFWIAFKIHHYLHMNMPYVRTGGWNAAPTVLERGNGSCSEFTFAFMALARASGLPARYEAGIVVRQDDGSIDDVYHRWVEVYLPPFGWVPADPSRGKPATAMDVAASFGSLSHRFFITTHSGGDSPILGWTYNYRSLYEFTGRARVEERSEAKWEPLKD